MENSKWAGLRNSAKGLLQGSARGMMLAGAAMLALPQAQAATIRGNGADVPSAAILSAEAPSAGYLSAISHTASARNQPSATSSQSPMPWDTPTANQWGGWGRGPSLGEVLGNVATGILVITAANALTKALSKPPRDPQQDQPRDKQRERTRGQNGDDVTADVGPESAPGNYAAPANSPVSGEPGNGAANEIATASSRCLDAARAESARRHDGAYPGASRIASVVSENGGWRVDGAVTGSGGETGFRCSFVGGMVTSVSLGGPTA